MARLIVPNDEHAVSCSCARKQPQDRGSDPVSGGSAERARRNPREPPGGLRRLRRLAHPDMVGPVKPSTQNLVRVRTPVYGLGGSRAARSRGAISSLKALLFGFFLLRLKRRARPRRDVT